MPNSVSHDLIYTSSFLDKTEPVLQELLKVTPPLSVSVDETKRPQNARNLMHQYKDPSANAVGTSGTYIKFEDDI